jgi:hypothetical protein
MGAGRARLHPWLDPVRQQVRFDQIGICDPKTPTTKTDVILAISLLGQRGDL